MPAAPPQDRFLSFPCTGVLNEWLTPSAVGGSGLTDCANLIYHRNGSWGKRPGATRFVVPNLGPKTPASGFRWYRAWPTNLTKLVIYANSHLLVGNDESSLNDIGRFDLSGTYAPGFCSIRDPQARQGNGADILVITGITLPTGSYGTGQMTISGLPGVLPVGVYIDVTLIDGSGNSVTTAPYYVTGADNPDSIASNLCELINATAAFLNQIPAVSYPPFIGTAYFTSNTLPFGATDSNGQPQPPTNAANYPKATIFLGGRYGGAAENSITYQINIHSGSGVGSLVVAPTSPTNFTGGGQPWKGPCKYEPGAGTVGGLSYMCSNAFSFCTTWHDHLWTWGDKGNPDTVFASNILQPEDWTFMLENGGMKGPVSGGYTIGAGDGDATIQLCLPVGNALYVFKTSNIYMIEGYDFQSGEYSFSVTPQVVGYGIPTPYCADVLDGKIVFWSGRKALRLEVGAYEPEHIGMPIPLSEGAASAGNQRVVRVVAGDMQALTLLNDQFISAPAGPSTFIMRSLALFAVDLGDGKPDSILVYDDEKSALSGEYAWSKWFGWNVGYWIQYGAGPNPADTDTDKPLITFIDPSGNEFHKGGQNASFDWENPIPWMAQPGWITGGTPEVIKNFHGMFIASSATAGATFSATLAPGRVIVPAPPPQASTFGVQPMTLAFNPTQAPANCEAFNELSQYVNTGQTQGQLPIQAKAVVVQVTEPGTSGAGFGFETYALNAKPEESLST